MALVREPGPFSVQNTPVAVVFEAEAPLTVKFCPWQIVPPGPAFARGNGFMVSTIASVAGPQGAFPLAVNVRVTEPAAISAVLGV